MLDIEKLKHIIKQYENFKKLSIEYKDKLELLEIPLSEYKSPTMTINKVQVTRKFKSNLEIKENREYLIKLIKLKLYTIDSLIYSIEMLMSYFINIDFDILDYKKAINKFLKLERLEQLYIIMNSFEFYLLTDIIEDYEEFKKLSKIKDI